MPVHVYENWKNRTSDEKEQKEPYRKYIFICEGANTETFYFKHLIDQRKQLGIHPLINICLWEKTQGDKDISYPKHLLDFAEKQKKNPQNEFDRAHDKMVIVFDGDIFEEKVSGYDELIEDIEKDNIAAVTNPGFELFLLLHIPDTFEKYIRENEGDFLTKDEKGKYSHAYCVLLKETGINAKTNSRIGELAEKVQIAIEQEKKINQDIHHLKGKVTSNIGSVIEGIINDDPGRKGEQSLS